MAPKLPGVKSPLKKSPYKFNAGLKEAAAEGKLDNNPKFKEAVESSPAKNKEDGKKERKASSITYDPETKTITRTLPAEGGLLEKKVTTKVSPVKKSCGYKK
ncbi:MAG: hypothetical protein EBT71_06920 [Alphaproteobacteria bacterium]|nr:hypothetical protein [Alphaproteobacteria bacterium]